MRYFAALSVLKMRSDSIFWEIARWRKGFDGKVEANPIYLLAVSRVKKKGFGAEKSPSDYQSGGLSVSAPSEPQ